jgi:hypothetical protein
MLIICSNAAGDLIYAEIAGRPWLILSSLEDAEELLVRRATVWSGRAENRLVNELYVKTR